MESLAALGLGVFAVYFISFIFSLGILWLVVRVARHAWAWNGSTLIVLLPVAGLLAAVLLMVAAFWSQDHKEKAEETAETISETAPDTLPANLDFNKPCWTQPNKYGIQLDQNLDVKVASSRQSNNVLEVDGRMRAIAATRAGVKRIPIKIVRPHVYDKGGRVSVSTSEPEELVPSTPRVKGILDSARASSGGFSSLAGRVLRALGISAEAKAGLAEAGFTEDQLLKYVMRTTPAEIEAKYGKAA
jgi:hypothetical protein